jgi:hypothetical protein
MVPTKLIVDFLYSNQLCCDREPTGTSFISVWFQLNHLCIRYDRIVATTFGGSLCRWAVRESSAQLYILFHHLYLLEHGGTGVDPLLCFAHRKKAKPWPLHIYIRPQPERKGLTRILSLRLRFCTFEAVSRAHSRPTLVRFLFIFLFLKNEKGEYIPRPAG